MIDFGDTSQLFETVAVDLGQVADTLHIFDECVCDEMALSFSHTEDPHAHHFEDIYDTFRSLLMVSISRIAQIAEDCNGYSDQILEVRKKVNQK